MTLKLITKNLPNKYAEQLYKNESSYDKELDKKFERLKVDFVRNSQMVDTSSQVFLNQIKSKRNQWRKDDMKYREHYKLFCRSTYSRYLENNAELVKELNRNRQQEHIKAKNQAFIAINKPNVLRSRSDGQISFKNPRQVLPPIKTASERELEKKSLDEMLKSEEYLTINKSKLDYKPFQHGKYSLCDAEFLSKLPDRVELTVTEVGKKFIENKKELSKTIKRNRQRFKKLQDNAVVDHRFKRLMSSLDL